MARERYSSYVQRAPQSDSDAEEHIFVGGKDAANGGVRKRVGDIRFWLEDRENRRKRAEVNARTAKSDQNTRSQNSSPPKALKAKSKRRHTTTPRRILSHIESKQSYVCSAPAIH